MESKLKAQAMDQAGEVYENLLLRESGYPHLPDPVFVPSPKADAWNDAGTKPDHPCLCETILNANNIKSFQYWNGEYWGFACATTDQAVQHKNYRETILYVIKWREVQP